MKERIVTIFGTSNARDGDKVFNTTAQIKLKKMRW